METHRGLFQWQRVPPPQGASSGEGWPKPVRVHTAAQVGTIIYIWGGYQASCCNSVLYTLDTETLEWKVRRPKGGPTALAYGTANAIGRKIYYFGGTEFTRKTNSDVYVLDTDTLEWKLMEVAGSKPPPRCGHMAFTVGRNLFIYGGSDKLGDYAGDLWMLNTDERRWVEVETTGDVPIGRNSGIMSVVGDDVYLFGGRTVIDHSVNDFYRLNLSTWEWTMLHSFEPVELAVSNSEDDDKDEEESEGQGHPKPNAKPQQVPWPRVDHRAVVFKKKIFLLMGTQLRRNGSLYTFGDVHCYDTETGKWSIVQAQGSAPAPVCGHSATLYGDKIFVVGGLDANYKEQDQCYVLRIPQTELSLVDLCVRVIKQQRLYSKADGNQLPRDLEELLTN